MVTFQTPGLIVLRVELACREGFPLILEDHLVVGGDRAPRGWVWPGPSGNPGMACRRLGALAPRNCALSENLPQQAACNPRRLRGLLTESLRDGPHPLVSL